MEFIEGARKGRGCIFCKCVAQDFSPANISRPKGLRYRSSKASFATTSLVLYRGKYCFVMMNKYPYNNGHLMVVPYIHRSEILNLRSEIQQELIWLTGESVRILKKVLKCQGANCGMNIGNVAGAGIVGHVHMHVVPRWLGDSNFMPVIGNARSMPEYLSATFKKLKPEFDKL